MKEEVVEGWVVVLLAPGAVNCVPRLSCAEARRPDVLVPVDAGLPPLGVEVVLPCWSNVVSIVVVGDCTGDCVGGDVAVSADVAGAGFACVVVAWLDAGPGGGAFVEDAGKESVDGSGDCVLLSVVVWTCVSLVEVAAVVAGNDVPVEEEGVGDVAVSVCPVVSGDAPVEDGTELESA